MKKTFIQTPNMGRIIKPACIVLHHSAGSYAGGVAWILDKLSKVSYHYLVNLNGDYTQFAETNRMTFSNGQSIWKGRNFVNQFAINIAVSLDTNTRVLTQEEIDTVAKLCVENMRKYNIGLENVTTHRAISPGRKTDVDQRSEKSIKDEITKIIIS